MLNINSFSLTLVQFKLIVLPSFSISLLEPHFAALLLSISETASVFVKTIHFFRGSDLFSIV